MNPLSSSPMLFVSVLFAVAALPPAFAQEGADPTVASSELESKIAPPPQEAPVVTPVVQAVAGGTVEITTSDDDPSHLVQARFDDVTLARLADELGRATGANVVASQRVAGDRITISLRNVDLDGALDAVAMSMGLLSRSGADNDIYFLASAEEVEEDLSSFVSRETEVFTLLYPNTNDVVRAIGDVFGERVVVSQDDQGTDSSLQELQNRFQRFDIVEGRSSGLSGRGSGGGNSGGTNIQGQNGMQLGRGAMNGQLGQQGQNSNNGGGQRDEFREFDGPELTDQQRILLGKAGAGEAEASRIAGLLAARQAVTYVSSIQRLNRIIVRSGDPEVMEQIRTLIQRLDVPTPLVLLEVRVLRVDLSDGLDSSFDFAFDQGKGSGSFSQGEIAPPGEGSILPGGSGLDFSAGVFQVVSDSFQARMQVLQSKGRVTSLATPVLMTASGEVSRIFSGEQIPIVIGFTEPQVIVGDGATTTLSATPVTELRDVGTELLITANINADRTVTLRLLQETSEVTAGGASILVPSGGSFSSQVIDTVQSQSASGTVVAQDGLLLAFGGLIEETEGDQRQQVPLLGDLPLFGFLFRRDASIIQRNELIVLVRPYVLSTAIEGDQISRNWLDSLSVHPYRPGDGAATGAEDDWGVFRKEQPSFNRSIFDRFRFHTAPSFNGGATGVEAP